MTSTTNTVRKVNRGDVLLLPIAFVSGHGSKVRPAVVVQNDALNRRLQSTVVAIITSTNQRASKEPTQVLVDVSTPDGKATGLLHNSTVKAEHLDTVDQGDILRVVGRFSDHLMRKVELCIAAALVIRP